MLAEMSLIKDVTIGDNQIEPSIAIDIDCLGAKPELGYAERVESKASGEISESTCGGLQKVIRRFSVFSTQAVSALSWESFRNDSLAPFVATGTVTLSHKTLPSIANTGTR